MSNNDRPRQGLPTASQAAKFNELARERRLAHEAMISNIKARHRLEGLIDEADDDTLREALRTAFQALDITQSKLTALEDRVAELEDELNQRG